MPVSQTVKTFNLLNSSLFQLLAFLNNLSIRTPRLPHYYSCLLYYKYKKMTHTHTHTYIYIYIYIIPVSLKKLLSDNLKSGMVSRPKHYFNKTRPSPVVSNDTTRLCKFFISCECQIKIKPQHVIIFPVNINDPSKKC